MTLKGSFVTKCALAYLGAPTVVFLIGWLRWGIGVPAALLVCAALIAACRRIAYGQVLESIAEPAEELKMSPMVALALVACVVIWCVMAGQGGFVVQTSDWHWRNATFRDLITHEWPVRYDAWNRALVFYVGHWLPAALVGKLTLAATGSLAMAWRVGNLALLAWTATGVALALVQFILLVNANSTFRQAVCFLLLVFWGGCDFLGSTLLNIKQTIIGEQLNNSWWMVSRWWSREYQFSSNSTCLYWVFHHAVSAWVLILLVARGIPLLNVALALSFAVLCTPLAGIGIAFFVVTLMAHRLYEGIKRGDLRAMFFDALSFQNMVGVFIVVPTVAMFLFSNPNSAALSPAWRKMGASYFVNRTSLFLFCEVGLYFMLTAKFCCRNIYWWCALFWLCLCPVVRVDGGADFCMRASIPALMVLSVLVFRTVSHYLCVRCWKGAALLACIVIGACDPTIVMVGQMCKTLRVGFCSVISDRIVTFDQDLEAKFMRENGYNKKGYWPGIGDWVTSKCNIKSPDDAFFYRHMARRPVDQRSGQ